MKSEQTSEKINGWSLLNTEQRKCKKKELVKNEMDRIKPNNSSGMNFNQRNHTPNKLRPYQEIDED